VDVLGYSMNIITKVLLITCVNSAGTINFQVKYRSLFCNTVKLDGFYFNFCLFPIVLVVNKKTSTVNKAIKLTN